MTDRDRMLPLYGAKIELDYGLTINQMIPVRLKKRKNHRASVHTIERKPGEAFNFIESNKHLTPAESIQLMQRVSNLKINNIQADLEQPLVTLKSKRQSIMTNNRPVPIAIERTNILELGGHTKNDPDDFSRQTTNDLPASNTYAYAPTQIA